MCRVVVMMCKMSYKITDISDLKGHFNHKVNTGDYAVRGNETSDRESFGRSIKLVPRKKV